MSGEGWPVDVVQLVFLRLLSTGAHQSFTYLCQNSVGWRDASLSLQGALRFRASSGEELTYLNTHDITATHACCQVCVLV